MYELKRKDLLYPELSFLITGILFKVYNDLGAGHHEKYYQIGVEKGLRFNGVRYKREVPAILEAYGEKVGNYFLDFLVEDKIVLELKRGKWIKKRDVEQVKRYLVVTKLKLGILAIFKSDEVKLYRVVNWDVINNKE